MANEQDGAFGALIDALPDRIVLHDFRPHRKYPWFCADCGYPPHEILKHKRPPEAPSE